MIGRQPRGEALLPSCPAYELPAQDLQVPMENRMLDLRGLWSDPPWVFLWFLLSAVLPDSDQFFIESQWNEQEKNYRINALEIEPENIISHFYPWYVYVFWKPSALNLSSIFMASPKVTNFYFWRNLMEEWKSYLCKRGGGKHGSMYADNCTIIICSFLKKRMVWINTEIVYWFENWSLVSWLSLGEAAWSIHHQKKIEIKLLREEELGKVLESLKRFPPLI